MAVIERAADKGPDGTGCRTGTRCIDLEGFDDLGGGSSCSRVNRMVEVVVVGQFAPEPDRGPARQPRVDVLVRSRAIGQACGEVED